MEVQMEFSMKQDDFEVHMQKWVCNTARKILKGNEASPVSHLNTF